MKYCPGKKSKGLFMGLWFVWTWLDCGTLLERTERATQVTLETTWTGMNEIMESFKSKDSSEDREWIVPVALLAPYDINDASFLLTDTFSKHRCWKDRRETVCKYLKSKSLLFSETIRILRNLPLWNIATIEQRLVNLVNMCKYYGPDNI